tara:strand:+ start:1218 stop:1322 length:105 start_codon:yes stop_codon:yes gene_type:complete
MSKEEKYIQYAKLVGGLAVLYLLYQILVTLRILV